MRIPVGFLWKIISTPCTAALRCGAASALFLPSASAVAEALTLLTLEGDLRAVAEIPQPSLRRIAATEGGFNVVVDDYAVMRVGSKGSVISFATSAFRIDANHLAAVNRELSSTAARSGANASVAAGSQTQRVGPAFGLKPSLSRFNLIVRHQSGHSAGHNFTPTPRMQFLPRVVIDDSLEGQRGFAVVSVGETGRIMQIKTLSEDGPIRSPKLNAVIASGLQTFFQDERRHDHTVYFAYEVRGQEVRQVGQSFVTLPMCCGGCQGICP